MTRFKCCKRIFDPDVDDFAGHLRDVHGLVGEFEASGRLVSTTDGPDVHSYTVEWKANGVTWYQISTEGDDEDG